MGDLWRYRGACDSAKDAFFGTVPEVFWNFIGLEGVECERKGLWV